MTSLACMGTPSNSEGISALGYRQTKTCVAWEQYRTWGKTITITTYTVEPSYSENQAGGREELAKNNATKPANSFIRFISLTHLVTEKNVTQFIPMSHGGGKKIHKQRTEITMNSCIYFSRLQEKAPFAFYTKISNWIFLILGLHKTWKYAWINITNG